MNINYYFKKWAKGTPIGKFFDNKFKMKSINYDALDFSKKEPTLMNRGLFKFSEFLWYANGNIEKIVSKDNYIIVKFSFNSESIYLNVFEEEVIQKLTNLNEDKEYLAVIKTRIPFRPELLKFHELRYLKEG